MCEMRVKKEPGLLKILVDDFSCGVLTAAELCHHLQRLLKCEKLDFSVDS